MVRVLLSGIFEMLKEAPETVDYFGVLKVRCGQIWLSRWSDIGLIFGQNWSDCQSDFGRFRNHLHYIQRFDSFIVGIYHE